MSSQPQKKNRNSRRRNQKQGQNRQSVNSSEASSNVDEKLTGEFGEEKFNAPGVSTSEAAEDSLHGVDEFAEHDLVSGDFYHDEDQTKRGIIFGNSLDTCTGFADDAKSFDFFENDEPTTKGSLGIKCADATDSYNGLENLLEVPIGNGQDSDTCEKKQTAPTAPAAPTLQRAPTILDDPPDQILQVPQQEMTAPTAPKLQRAPTILDDPPDQILQETQQETPSTDVGEKVKQDAVEQKVPAIATGGNHTLMGCQIDEHDCMMGEFFSGDDDVAKGISLPTADTIKVASEFTDACEQLKSDSPSVLPSQRGITLAQVQSFFMLCKQKDAWRDGMTVRDLITEIVNPFWNDQGRCVALDFNSAKPLPISHFVSHSWDGNAKEFLEDLLTIPCPDSSVLYVHFLSEGSHDMPLDSFGQVISQVRLHRSKSGIGGLYVIPNRALKDNGQGLYSKLRVVWEIQHCVDSEVPVEFHPAAKTTDGHLFGKVGRLDYKAESACGHMQDSYLLKTVMEQGCSWAKLDTTLRDVTPREKGQIQRTVALFADYDGCFDIISPSNPKGAKMDKMFDYAEQIGRLIHPRKYAQKLLLDFVKQVTDGAAKVILFSGSNRQSHKADEFNAVQNDNGLAMTGLKQLAKEYGWEFNSNLLENVGKNPSDIMNAVGGSSKIKQMLAENNFKCLPGKTEVYFFDDVEKYLKFTRDRAKVPDNIDLKTVLFDWYGICIDGTQDGPLVPVSPNSS